jgi:hypothetical protein
MVKLISKLLNNGHWALFGVTLFIFLKRILSLVHKQTIWNYTYFCLAYISWITSIGFLILVMKKRETLIYRFRIEVQAIKYTLVDQRFHLINI